MWANSKFLVRNSSGIFYCTSKFAIGLDNECCVVGNNCFIMVNGNLFLHAEEITASSKRKLATFHSISAIVKVSKNLFPRVSEKSENCLFFTDEKATVC